ncbi:MAG: hypothetical protein ABI867_00875 [Kofleriaceae bacterium]
MRWAPLAMVLGTGCLHPSSLTCPGPDGTSWVCPADLACAQAPTYCGTAQEVGACDGKAERDPCSTSLVPVGLCISSVCEACSNDIAGCRHVGWLPMTSPTAGILHAVVFTKFGEAYAGGDDGAIYHYLNAGWEVDSRFTATAGTPITSLSAAGDKVYALVGNTKVFVLANGAWSMLSAQPGKAYKAIWAAASGELFAAGPAGNLGRFDGLVWDESYVGPAAYNAVWGASATDVYAVGSNATITHYTGSWSSATGGTGIHAAVWGAGGDVFVAGASIAHGSGAAFTSTSFPVAFNVRALWGSAADDMFAVGDGGVVIHWDGVAWTQMQASTSTLFAIAGSGPDEVFAVGDGGTISRYTGAAWATANPPSGTTMPLLDVAALGPDEVVAVGGDGIFHLRTTVWMQESMVPFAAVAARGPSDALVVGSNVGKRWDGSVWTPTGGGGFGTAADVWPWTSSYALVSDDVWTFSGTDWTRASTSSSASTRGLWVAPSGRFWLAGAGISHLDGSTLTPDLATGAYSAIWGAAEDDVFAVGGTIQHYDGSAWAAMTVPTTSSLAGIWGRAGDDVFAVGSSNTVLHYHAGLWVQFPAPFSGDLTSVSGAGSSIYMTSSDGKVHRLIDTAP